MKTSEIVELLDEYAYENWQGHVGYFSEIRSYIITDRLGDFCYVSDEIDDIGDLEQSVDMFCDC